MDYADERALAESKLTKEDMQKAIDEFSLLIQKGSETLKLTCLGMQNGGKSSLLNALTHSFDNARFRVADAIETKEIQSFEVGNICYVDTPGINVDEYDDLKAFYAVKHSHLNLFVHNAKTGDITAVEKEYLEALAKKYGQKQDEFIQNTIFVLSRKDECSKDDVIKVESTLKDQIRRIFKDSKIEPTFVNISSKSYIKGHNENKKRLIESSNIPTLEELIKEKIAHISVATQHKKRVDAEYLRIKHLITSHIQTLDTQIDEDTQSLKTIQENIKAEIKKANKTLQKIYE